MQYLLSLLEYYKIPQETLTGFNLTKNTLIEKHCQFYNFHVLK
jgi:hypothetical protein